MLEMTYLWRQPLRLDNRRLVAFLGEEPHTPAVEAARRSLEGMGVPGELIMVGKSTLPALPALPALPRAAERIARKLVTSPSQTFSAADLGEPLGLRNRGMSKIGLCIAMFCAYIGLLCLAACSLRIGGGSPPPSQPDTVVAPPGSTVAPQ